MGAKLSCFWSGEHDQEAQRVSQKCAHNYTNREGLNMTAESVFTMANATDGTDNQRDKAHGFTYGPVGYFNTQGNTAMAGNADNVASPAGSHSPISTSTTTTQYRIDAGIDYNTMLNTMITSSFNAQYHNAMDGV